MQLIRIGNDCDTVKKFGNLIVVLNQCLKKCQLGFSLKIEVPQLGSAQKLHSSGSLEPENFSSNSSLVFTLSVSFQKTNAGGLGLMTKHVRFKLDAESTKRSWSPRISVRGSVRKKEKNRSINLQNNLITQLDIKEKPFKFQLTKRITRLKRD